MPERICDICGQKKDVYGGKVCPSGHFLCAGCAYGRSACPLCGKEPLR